jgi:hypothetical protein
MLSRQRVQLLVCDCIAWVYRHVYRLNIIVSLWVGSHGFSPTTEVELDDASPALRYLKSASDAHGPKQIKIEVSDSDVPDQKHTQTENSDSDEPDQKYIKIESSDSDAPNSKHIKIGSSDSDAPDPKHITIEDPNSDASLGDLPILEPPKKVRRDYECDQEYDFRPGLTSTPVQQFKCEPTDVDDDFPTVMMPTSTFCIEDPKDYTSTVELHNGSVPIYSKPSKRLTSKEIVELCVGGVEDKYICKTKPVSVRFNAVFVIDLHKVDMKSLYVDDNGVWKTYCPKSYLMVCFNEGKVERVEMSSAVNYTHFIKRQYGTHQ